MGSVYVRSVVNIIRERRVESIANIKKNLSLVSRVRHHISKKKINNTKKYTNIYIFFKLMQKENNND